MIERRACNLTDADVEALADALKEPLADALKDRIKAEFYTDIGRGVWGMAWKGIVIIIVAIAYYGWKS